MLRLDDDVQQLVAEEEKDAEQEDAQAQHKQCPMLKHHTDFVEVALAKASRNEDLDAHGKAHRQSGEDEIIQARHHGGTQFVGAKMTEKGCISEGDDGLRKVAQHDGICDAPDFLVGNGGFNHGAKLVNSSAPLNQFSQFSQFFFLNIPKKCIFATVKKRTLKMKKIIVLLLTTLLLGFVCAERLHAQLIVTDASTLNGWTADSLVRNILLDNGVTISNARFNGSNRVIDCNSIGIFETGNTPTNLGIESGLLLASGGISVAVGPNTDESFSVPTTCMSYYDNDLASIASDEPNDVAVLEFDFVPWDNMLSFSFVFGSEEYMEYVGMGYNDVFGFFVEGANPAGGYYDHQNMALIPGTTEVVSIDNVNLYHNSAYYIDNTGGASIQFDGFTTVIEVSFDVIPMSNYHIKMAICDVGDDMYDSGVFLEAHSFTTNLSYSMTIDDWIYTEIPENHYFCSNQAVEFNTVTNWNYDDVVWYFGDGTSAQGEQVTHTYSADGFYTVTNVLHNPHRDMDSIFLTKEIEVRTLSSEEHVTSCDSYEWYGTTYTESGTYTHVVQTPGTCDSILVLNLEIGNSYSSEQDVTACNSYNWRGTTYTESGTYTDFVTSPGACDSTFVLNLTLGHDVQSDTTAVTCDAFTWHGTTYTESGDYPYLTQTVMGCDSLLTLHLTVGHEQTHPTEEEVTCENSFTWHGHSYSHDGVYYDTITDAAGCDEIYSLDLTFVEAYNTNLIETVCDSYPWPSADGGYLTESGQYKYEGTTQSGCDSIVDLDLTVYYTPSPAGIHPVDTTNKAPHWVITATEFQINSYDFHIWDNNPICGWDTVTWSFEEPVQWLLEPYGDQGKHCKMYVLNYMNDTVWLTARAFNHCAPEGIEQRYWFVCSFYGLEETGSETAGFNVIPNPNDGQMRLSFDHLTGKVGIKVYDMMGSLVDDIQTYNGLDHNELEYSLKGRTKGIYFFVATGKEGTVAKKVVIR